MTKEYSPKKIIDVDSKRISDLESEVEKIKEQTRWTFGLMILGFVIALVMLGSLMLDIFSYKKEVEFHLYDNILFEIKNLKQNYE